MEFFLGAIVAIVLGVMANLITPYLEKFFKHDHEFEERPPASPPKQPSEDLEGWRELNRRELETVVNKVFTYGFSYFAMYLAFYVPLVISGGYIDTSVNLQSTRFGLEFIIDSENISIICAYMAVFLYLPFWKLAQTISSYVCKLLWRFTFINEIKFLAITCMSMIFCAFFIAGNVNYFLSLQAGWWESIRFSLMIGLLVFGAAFLNQNQR